MGEHAYQGYNVIKKVRLTDGHAEPHRMVRVHDVNVEMIWTFPESVGSSCER